MMLSIGQVRKKAQQRPTTKGLFHPKFLKSVRSASLRVCHLRIARNWAQVMRTTEEEEEEVFQCPIVPQSLPAWQNGFWLWLGLFGSSSGNVMIGHLGTLFYG
jgi:hypothetical protein